MNSPNGLFSCHRWEGKGKKRKKKNRTSSHHPSGSRFRYCCATFREDIVVTSIARLAHHHSALSDPDRERKALGSSLSLVPHLLTPFKYLLTQQVGVFFPPLPASSTTLPPPPPPASRLPVLSRTSSANEASIIAPLGFYPPTGADDRFSGAEHRSEHEHEHLQAQPAHRELGRTNSKHRFISIKMDMDMSSGSSASCAQAVSRRPLPNLAPQSHKPKEKRKKKKALTCNTRCYGIGTPSTLVSRFSLSRFFVIVNKSP